MTPSGFLNLDKPAGWTSRAAVDGVVDVVGTRRVGHAGTLDPMATGVLVVGVDRATRLLEYVQRMPKTYEATILLGQTSDTDDLEGTVRQHPMAALPDTGTLAAALAGFVGTVLQRPPGYSAIKHRGKRAYRLARQGLDVPLAPRAVTIHAIELLGYEPPAAEVRITCGSGTYIRALARDLGERLGTGGLLSRLCRTAVGGFVVADAFAPFELDASGAWDRLQPLEAGVAGLPHIVLTDDDARRFCLGQMIYRPLDLAPGEVAAFDLANAFLGIGLWEPEQNQLRPAKTGFRPTASAGAAGS